MLSCINKKSVEYLSLKLKANIPDFLLEAYCRKFTEKYDRFPYLDELPGSNSEPELRKSLKIKENQSTKISDILDYTGSESIEDANIKINNIYKDLETEITPITNEAIVEITHRPVTTNNEITPITLDTTVNNYMVFNNFLMKLAKLYGINFMVTNSDELNSEEWRDLIQDAQLVNAFVYNGNIYLNEDNMSVDAPLHEMMHLFIGSMRFSNPSLYEEIIASAESFPNYDELASQYENRTRNDINEEIFITESAKYVTGLPSMLSNLDPKIHHEIMYNIKRVLDSMLMGLDSVKTISDVRLMNMTLKEVALAVNSESMINHFSGFFNQKNSSFHRLLNNMKHDLLKSGLLIEECD